MTDDQRHFVILFDGVCNFCNGSVQFIIRRDRKGRFRFASLQSSAGKQLLARHRIREQADSIVLIENGSCFTESTAVLRIAGRMSGIWKIAAILLVIPKPIRDCLYRYFARNRYRWFGKQEACMIPTEETRKRFLSLD